MSKTFPKSEYDDRLVRVRQAMEAKGLDAMVVGDPANMNWLTGFDAWSFYVPQIMVVSLDREPVWIGREMDAGAAALTTYMDPADVIPYPEDLIQREDAHPSEYMAGWMTDNGFGGKTIGYESDVYFFSPKALCALQTGSPNARWVDADLTLNWVRAVKSEAEIEMMRQAAVLAGLGQRYAWDNVRPGVRQCDLAAGICSSVIAGTAEFGGDSPALSALILAGEAAATAHPMWTDTTFGVDQTVAFELGGCRKRYNAGLARTVHLGSTLPGKVAATAEAVEEGLERVLEALKAGAIAADVHTAWQKVLDPARSREKEPHRIFDWRRLRPGLGRAHYQSTRGRNDPHPRKCRHPRNARYVAGRLGDGAERDSSRNRRRLRVPHQFSACGAPGRLNREMRLASGGYSLPRHKTHPRDIDRAMESKYSTDPTHRVRPRRAFGEAERLIRLLGVIIAAACSATNKGRPVVPRRSRATDARLHGEIRAGPSTSQRSPGR